MRKKIIVIGSSNTDLVVRSPRLPKAGETIIGTTFFQNQGGKGANQAVAAARLGGEVTFVANVGRDDYGNKAIQSYEKDGITTSFINKVDVPTGMAMINVDDNAENCIVVIPGANDTLSNTHIDAVASSFNTSTVILLQLEVPLPTIEYVVSMAKSNGAQVILNPAPANSLSDNTLKLVDVITPNETELELLTGIKVDDKSSLVAAVNFLHDKGIPTVIVTLGAKGCFVSDGKIQNYYAAPKVHAIDTTAAGDVFNGALTTALSLGNTLEEGVQFALKAASISVTRNGAQESIPTLSEL
ncbi:ribokinase [Flammeovirga sp. EKP202]|uniref:ribokinase n=1 Tax=Flammeovirga sp. EKP202 TaxID=2770592 RepID=UPI00165F49C6|nr:ribokinase [Flammeovirga sp. EKP202]MBD0401586.1 ribokinase [Flammeovirga sp. EKP202]